MKKWIRWPGLVGFIAFMTIVSAFWLYFVNGFIKQAIEDHGTGIIGAKVELDNADISLFPLGLTLTRLQVTDPDKPTTNAVEIARIVCSIEGQYLLWGKVVVPEMILDQVRLNTPRKTSGAITKPTHPESVVSQEAKSEKFQLPTMEKVPSVEEILEKEQLESQEIIKSIKTDLATKKVSWKKKLAKLPDQKKVEEYKQKLKKSKSLLKGGIGDIFGKVKEGTTTLKDIQDDLNLITSARKDLKEDLTLIRKREREAKKALRNDIQRLKDKYSLSSQGIANMSKLLFGEKIGEYTKTFLRWYERLQPLFARDKEKEQKRGIEKPIRGKGLNIRFKETEPIPDFLIRLVRVTNIKTQIGTLSGRIENITPDQDILGAPLTFSFYGDTIKDVDYIRLDGVFNHISLSNSKDNLDFQVKKYKAQNVILSDNEELPTTLQEGLADLDVKTILRGEVLTANLMADLTSTKFSVGGKGKTNSLVNSALSNVSEFTLGADITGNLNEPDIKLKSNLDDIIKDVGSKMVKDQAAKFEKKLDSAITKKVSGQLSELNGDIGGFKGLDGDLANRLKQLSGLL